jgi:uncharacterized Ntn-hydrolase superfamily protein
VHVAPECGGSQAITGMGSTISFTKGFYILKSNGRCFPCIFKAATPVYMKSVFLLLALSLACAVTAQTYRTTDPLAHTYSIVARDAATGEIGVAVQSHWFSVGTSVSWAEAGVGAIATQSFINKSFGPRGLALLRSGLTAQQALDSLLATDEGRDVRQLAIVDTAGNVAVHTGKKCIDHGGHIDGNGFSVQANMMLTDKVPQAMATAFEKSGGKPLAERLLGALDAAQAAGGDIRGKQSAALIVVPARSHNEPWNERPVDLRVDDSPAPLRELRRLYNVQVAYEHMNAGDLATEKADMQGAMAEYGAAMKMFPQNLEMQYWTAITLANNGQVTKAMPMLKRVFAADKNWKELTRRLPKVGLLTVSDADLKKILSL